MKFSHLVCALAALSVCGVAATARATASPFGLADKFMDITFDSSNNGDPIPTTAPVAQALPQDTPYSTGGFPDTLPITGTTTIGTAGTLTKAAILSSTQGGTGALFMDTQFLKMGDIFGFAFDIDIAAAAATGYPQSTGPVGGAPDGQLFAVQGFGLDSNRVFRFAATPTSASGGNFLLRQPGISGDLDIIGSYTNGDVTHVSMLINFNTNTMDVYLNNVLAAGNKPLVNTGTGFSEFFFFDNGIEGSTTTVALDNIVAATPEPASLGLLGAGAAGLLLRRKK